MFDVAFSELLIIAVVALLVIGPERLPKVARTLGALTGRMQRYVAQVKEEVNREVRFQELQQLQQEIESAALKTQSSIQTQMDDVAANISKPFEEPSSLTSQKPPKDPE
jgi:sec-independent protein translocase protein TatB